MLALVSLPAFALGTVCVSCVSRVLFTQRSLTLANPTLAQRVAYGIALAAFSCLAWIHLEATAWPVATLGATLLACILTCDLHARCIPYQLCLGLLPLALAFCLIVHENPLLTLALAAVCACLLLLMRAVCALAKKTMPLGMGDVRLIPLLCVFSGVTGLWPGVFACAGTALLEAVYELVAKHGSRTAQIPLAPALCSWYCAAVLFS